MGSKDSPPPPDYGPMAQASKEAAEIGAAMGREQLAENKRQYDLNMQTAAPIIAAQQRNMDLAYTQGKESFDNYRSEGRPLQQSMRDIATGTISPEMKALMDRGGTEGVADVQAALDGQRMQTGRAMARMGVNPNSGKFAAAQGAMDIQAATAKAGAANAGRSQALDKGYARMGDTLNTYAGMASNAPSFYSAGTNAGNSAMGNQMSASNAYMGGMAAGTGTVMGGKQMQMGGLGNILSAQTSYANSMANQDNGLGGIGSVLGGVASIYSLSDRRLKENIVELGVHTDSGLMLYEFNYIGKEGRFRGVMAEDVLRLYPGAVVFNEEGYAAVDYGSLGIQMEEVA